MNVETETLILKAIEELKTEFRTEIKELKSEVKELRQDVNQINVNQVRLEGEVKALQKGQDDLKEEVKEFRNEIKGRVSNQGYWFLSLLSILVVFIGKLVFFPNP